MAATVTTESTRVVYDMPDREYRAAPGISQSALKSVADSPARYLWERSHRTSKDAFDFGHVVHSIVLGRGAEYTRLDFPDRRTKAFKDAESAARAAGLVPLIAEHHDRAEACAAAVLAHPLAGPILTRDGDSEVVVIWDDDDTGLPCKGMVDRVTLTPDGTTWLIDVKTTRQSAAPRSFASAVASYSYHMQAAFYLDGWRAATGVQARWLNVVVETSAPHMTAVYELDGEALEVGRGLYRDAIATYQQCAETGVWPGYTDTIAHVLSLPRWATYSTGGTE